MMRCQFLTSVGVDQASSLNEVYIAKRLQNLKVVDSYPVIDGTIDNFDQNEATLDGKATTHTIAAVVFHRGDAQGNSEPMPRSTGRSQHQMVSISFRRHCRGKTTTIPTPPKKSF